MGAVCCGNPNQNIPVSNIEKRQKIKIFGECFQTETRTILASLSFCGIDFEYIEVDTFTGEHQKDSYTDDINPTGQVPTIIHGNNLVIGGYSTYLLFLASQFPGLQQTLYPSQSAQEIDAHMLWYQSIFRPISQGILRQLIGNKVFGESEFTLQEKQQTKNELLQIILPKIDQYLKLKERNYICSDNELTIVDIQYFIEIQQLCMIDSDLAKQINKESFPELDLWMERVKKRFQGKSLLTFEDQKKGKVYVNKPKDIKDVAFNDVHQNFEEKLSKIKQLLL